MSDLDLAVAVTVYLLRRKAGCARESDVRRMQEAFDSMDSITRGNLEWNAEQIIAMEKQKVDDMVAEHNQWLNENGDKCIHHA